MEDKDQESSNSKPNNSHKEQISFNKPIESILLAKTFKELEAEALTNPKVQEYLATFHESVRNALRETDTPTGAIPFRGAITLKNLPELFSLMPDLYDYLKYCYSAIESSGDVIINKILDAAFDGDYKVITNIGDDRCREFLDNYIAYSYYNNYLQGYMPVEFSIDEWYPPQQEFVPMPRKPYWWKDMKILTWNEFKVQYPEKMKEYNETW